MPGLAPNDCHAAHIAPQTAPRQKRCHPAARFRRPLGALLAGPLRTITLDADAQRAAPRALLPPVRTSAPLARRAPRVGHSRHQTRALLSAHAGLRVSLPGLPSRVLAQLGGAGDAPLYAQVRTGSGRGCRRSCAALHRTGCQPSAIRSTAISD